MHTRLAFLAPAIALTVTGCSASSGPISAPVEAPHTTVTAPAASRILVWTTNQDGETMTWTLDDAGNSLGLDDGVRIAIGSAVWDWREVPEAVPTTACPSYDDAGAEVPGTEPSKPGTGVRVTFEREGGAGRIELVRPASEEGAAELEQDVDLVASVGPYLFIRESTYTYACGAHGGVGVGFSVFDAERGTRAWGSGDEGPFLEPGAVARELAAAQANLLSDEDVSAFVTDGKLDLDLTAVVPSYDADAALQLDLQFTASTCYACSDGVWSSYTKSTRRPLAEIPVSLRPFRVTPAGVATFLRAHPTLTVGGWSRLPRA